MSPVGLCARTSVCEMVVNAANQRSIAPANNQLFQDCSKQIDTQFHFTRDLVKEKWIPPNYVPIKDQLHTSLRNLYLAQNIVLVRGEVCLKVCALLFELQF